MISLRFYGVVLRFWMRLVRAKILTLQAGDDLGFVDGLCREIYGNELGYSRQGSSVIDEYDQHSVNFVLMVRGRPVGAVRLIMPMSDGLYVEKDFPVIWPKHLRLNLTGEISRLVLLPEYRGGFRFSSFSLIFALLNEAKKNHLENIVFVTGQRVARAFSVFGLKPKIVPCGEITKEIARVRDAMPEYYTKMNPGVYLIDLNNIKLKQQRWS